MRVTAIIAAGGAGRRLGAAVPKQLLDVAGQSMLTRSVRAFDAHPEVHEIIVAMPAELVERWMRYLARLLGQRRMADRQSAPDDPLARVLAKATDSELLRLWDELARDRLLLRGTTNPNARLLFESRLLAWKDLAIAV